MAWWNDPLSPPSSRAMEQARERQRSLTKPPGSLGRLEDIAVAFAGWQDTLTPRVDKVEICIFAGDHGVVAEGVSAFPQAVTVQMIQNFAQGGAAIAVLSRFLEASFRVINLGTANDAGEIDGVVDLQLAPGTANLCREPAMSAGLLQRALDSGAAYAPDGTSRETELFIGGEMGIGNTTSAAALASALLDLTPEDTVGRGTGVDEPGLARKRDVVRQSLERHIDDDVAVIDILRCLGGLEIAALCGAYIATAQRGIPSLVDGYICTTAALVACRLNPGVRDWLLFAHRSAEPGHRHLLRALDAEPLLDAGLCLGEGSGAAAVVPMLRVACELHNNMATFAEAGVADAGSTR